MLDPDPHHRSAKTEEPSDELLLAALERATLHRAKGDAVPVWSIFEHLDVNRRSDVARRARIRLDVMHAAGWIAPVRRQGIEMWALTSAGAAQLRRARRAGRVAALPESPQHRAWRIARTLAAQEIERMRRTMDTTLQEAAALLAAEPAASSDAWFELADRLRRDCRSLGSVSYCLREWSEPDDAHADVDERLGAHERGLARAERERLRALRAGRRNIGL